ncbi:hypothetical protein HRbin40_00252 [bacterium HR40]|nr:hypothetical protein HRbin40_00252 [bacterium HR40]
MTTTLPVPSPQASLVAGSTVAPAAAAPRADPAARVDPAPAITPHRDRTDLEALLRRAAAERHSGREVAVSLGRDQVTDHVVVRVHDRTTGEVIEQYPPEELLRFFAAARGESGRLLDIQS